MWTLGPVTGMDGAARQHAANAPLKGEGRAGNHGSGDNTVRIDNKSVDTKCVDDKCVDDKCNDNKYIDNKCVDIKCDANDENSASVIELDFAADFETMILAGKKQATTRILSR